MLKYEIFEKSNVSFKRHITFYFKFKNILKLLFSICFFYCYEIFSQETYFSWEGRIKDKYSYEFIPAAHVRVISEGRVFLFAADNIGKVIISYYKPTSDDSVLVTSIGYKPLSLSMREFQKTSEIQLESDIYSLNEVVITTEKRKKQKTFRLGNTAPFAIGSSSGSFGRQMMLLIKHENITGKIIKIRYYMKDPPNSDGWRLRPFRVRIYDLDTLNNIPGNDLLKEILIVSLKKGNWLEVDISDYNIQLPNKGVFVGMEILPAEYYLSNNIITHITSGKNNAFNSVSIGYTLRLKKSKTSFESWVFYPHAGWKREIFGDTDYLINIVLEKTE